ncbi:phosphoadenosine phosphosulfate reductase domain-containing protein [Methylobacterium sp. Gmos1]
MRKADPYLIQGPALISFSGGRTSGYMLKHILDAHGGTLPDDVHVAFANTGREMPETLDFVQECSERWGVRIVWLEFDPEAEHKTQIVNHNSASRNGEPFDAVIQKSRSGMLPNPVTRFCTVEMKIRRFYMLMHKMLGYDRWTSVVGLRADEPRRVEKQRYRNTLGKERFATAMPLADAGVTKRDVQTFWGAQPFDLSLLNVNGTTPDGNCDLCFLKSEGTILSTMRRRPETAEWWIGREAIAMDRTVSVETRNESVRRFRMDRRSYAALFDASQRQADLFEPQEESLDCACTD